MNAKPLKVQKRLEEFPPPFPLLLDWKCSFPQNELFVWEKDKEYHEEIDLFINQ